LREKPKNIFKLIRPPGSAVSPGNTKTQERLTDNNLIAIL
jgi:hypothetical protein